MILMFSVTGEIAVKDIPREAFPKVFEQLQREYFEAQYAPGKRGVVTRTQPLLGKSGAKAALRHSLCQLGSIPWPSSISYSSSVISE